MSFSSDKSSIYAILKRKIIFYIPYLIKLKKGWRSPSFLFYSVISFRSTGINSSTFSPFTTFSAASTPNAPIFSGC